jgi:ankyrin repeat protein
VGDVAAARRLLAADPALARAEGGPYRWEPLLYLAYGRIDSTAPGHDTLAVARLLLDAGADPDAGFLWESEYPFTALTGAFGNGEGGPHRQPPHQHALALARLLLEAGADPDDSQTLYNCQWNPDDDHIELLIEHGLGRGDRTVWATRLGLDHPTPQELVEEDLRRAAEKGRVHAVQLLLGVVDDPDGLGTDHPLREGRTAHQLAVLNGHTEVARLLDRAGARSEPLTPVEQLQAAAMRADTAEIERLVAADPALPGRLIEAAPGLPEQAVELDRADALRTLVGLGYDLNRTDRPTPLHTAAFHDNLPMARTLIELGADPNVHDPHFDSTPAGWAEYGEHPPLAAYLRSLERG